MRRDEAIATAKLCLPGGHCNNVQSAILGNRLVCTGEVMEAGGIQYRVDDILSVSSYLNTDVVVVTLSENGDYGTFLDSSYVLFTPPALRSPKLDKGGLAEFLNAFYYENVNGPLYKKIAALPSFVVGETIEADRFRAMVGAMKSMVIAIAEFGGGTRVLLYGVDTGVYYSVPPENIAQSPKTSYVSQSYVEDKEPEDDFARTMRFFKTSQHDTASEWYKGDKI